MRETLYPQIEPRKKGFLRVSPIHKIYWEECGNPKGYPILFVHGGPGAGCNKKNRRFFNPKKWRIILFDQRGSGKSKPFASTKDNTTWNLAQDIRYLLRFKGINKIVLFGSSWGSTLSLVYAILYPETITGLILGGIFLAEKEEINAYTTGEVGKYFPEIYERFIAQVPVSKQGEPASFYYQKMRSKDKTIRRRFAYEWAHYELGTLYLKEKTEKKLDEIIRSFPYESLGVLEAYYMVNNCFLPNGYILKHTKAIPLVPISIIQGRYDMVCPPISAYKLHRALPTSGLHMVLAGHSSRDAETTKKLVSETEKMYEKTARGV